jgi:hypothetical protein
MIFDELKRDMNEVKKVKTQRLVMPIGLMLVMLFVLAQFAFPFIGSVFGQPTIQISPSIVNVGTNGLYQGTVVVSGTGFTPNSPVYVACGFGSLFATSTNSAGSFSFGCQMNVHPGQYVFYAKDPHTQGISNQEILYVSAVTITISTSTTTVTMPTTVTTYSTTETINKTKTVTTTIRTTVTTNRTKTVANMTMTVSIFLSNTVTAITQTYSMEATVVFSTVPAGGYIVIPTIGTIGPDESVSLDMLLSYTIIAIPPSNYMSFNHWVATGNILIASYTSQETIMRVNGDGTVTAYFV